MLTFGNLTVATSMPRNVVPLLLLKGTSRTIPVFLTLRATFRGRGGDVTLRTWRSTVPHRFVTKGKTTVTLKKGARRLGEEACFSLAAEGKVLDFAVPSTVPDDGKSGQVHCMFLRLLAPVSCVRRCLMSSMSDAAPI